MTNPRMRTTGSLSGEQLEAEVGRELARIRQENPVRLPESRCRICQDPEVRARVNRLLAYGMQVPEVLDYLDDINDKRGKSRQITVSIVRNHAKQHFNLQDPTNAAWRRILERRQQQADNEFGEGVATLLTGRGFLDVVAQKGYQNLLDPKTIVSYDMGLKAMLKLEELQKEGAVEERLAQIRHEVSLLQQAVHDVLSDRPELMKALSDRLDELTGNVRDDIVEAEIVDDDDEDDDDVGYNPTLTADANDMLGED